MEFTREDGLSFVSNVLEVKEFEKKFDENKLTVLNEIIWSFHQHIPFNNIKHISKPFEDRRTPTLKESMEMVLSRQGGLCLTLNTVIFQVLRELGYDISLAVGTVISENDHVFCIAKVLDEDMESLFIVDVGFAFPTFKAVRLVPNGDSEVLSTVSLTLKYRHMANGDYCRLHRKVDKNSGDVSWETMFRFSLTPNLTVESVQKYVGDIVYENPEESNFNRVPFLVTYKGECMVAFKNGVLSIGNKNRTVDFFSSETDEEMIKELSKHFQYVKLVEFKKSFQRWREIGSPEFKIPTRQLLPL